MVDPSEEPRSEAPLAEPAADAARWAAAWRKPLDERSSAEWMRTREALDPLLEALASSDASRSAAMPEPLRAFIEAGSGPIAALDSATKSLREAAIDRLTGTLSPGMVFGRCGIVRLAGRGGMGEVYEALDLSLGEGASRRVALKLLPIPPNADRGQPILAEAFHRDVAALARLAHPSIARLYRTGVDRLPDGGERAFLVTEFVDGVPLLAFVEERCGSDRDRRARLASELGEHLASAMAASHRESVVHRDLKSANVLVRRDGSLAVVDFGIAALDAPADDGRTMADRLTRQPDALGSLSAISPERARGRFSGAQEDVWAIGALLFETLTLRRPHDLDGLGTLEAVRRIGDTPPPSVRSVDRRVPRDLAVVVDRCLAFDPKDRYADAAAVCEDLARIRRGFPPAARPIGALGRGWRFAKRHPAPVALATIAATALAVGSAVSIAFAVEARRAKAAAERREQVVRSVSDGLLVDVAGALRSIPTATAARQRLLELGLSYAESVGEDGFLATDRDAALELARALFTLGELHRMQQPNPSADVLGHEAFERTATLARTAAHAAGGFDAEALGLAARAEAIAIGSRGSLDTDARHAAWRRVTEECETIMEVAPHQPDALIALHWACLRVGDSKRLAGLHSEAEAQFERSVDATRRLVETEPTMAAAWFHRSAALNSMWWLLYTTDRGGNESRILGLLDEMTEAERRAYECQPETRALSSLLASEMTRAAIAIEFHLADPIETEEALAATERRIVELSEAEPELGVLRRRRAEAHLRRGDGLEMLATKARDAGDARDARRLALAAAEAFDACAAVQRDRIARREQVAANEDAMLAYAIEHAKALREAER